MTKKIKVEPYLEQIKELVIKGYCAKEIADEIQIGYRTLLNFIKQEKYKEDIFPNYPFMTSNCKECTSEFQRKIAGKHLFCSKKCAYNNHNKNSAAKYRQSEKGKLYHKKYELMKEYGLTYEDYLQLNKDQNNCCAICQSSFWVVKANVDHDHNSNHVRGLLCSKCNQGIGLLAEDVYVLHNAIIYLLSNSSKYNKQQGE